VDPTITIDRITDVINHATAPSFLLGAVAGFISIMFSRMETLIARMRQLNAIEENDTARVPLKQDLPRVERRLRLLHRAIFVGLLSAIAATMLVFSAFIFAFMDVTHVYSAALMFLLSLGLLAVSLSLFGREIMIALSEYERFQ
jgi:hypothetical protein